MGKKIPMWQCLVIILVMLAFLLWEIVVCQDGEGHLALIRAAIFAAIIAVANGWKWTFLEQGTISQDVCFAASYPALTLVTKCLRFPIPPIWHRPSQTPLYSTISGTWYGPPVRP